MSIARRQFLRYAGWAGPAAFLSLATARPQTSPVAAVPFKLPLKPNSTRFAIIGDSGTGDTPQFQIAQEMQRLHGEFSFEFVLMLGDNIYGDNNASSFRRSRPAVDRTMLFFWGSKSGGWLSTSTPMLYSLS